MRAAGRPGPGRRTPGTERRLSPATAEAAVAIPRAVAEVAEAVIPRAVATEAAEAAPGDSPTRCRYAGHLSHSLRCCRLSAWELSIIVSFAKCCPCRRGPGWPRLPPRDGTLMARLRRAGPRVTDHRFAKIARRVGWCRRRPPTCTGSRRLSLSPGAGRLAWLYSWLYYPEGLAPCDP